MTRPRDVPPPSSPVRLHKQLSAIWVTGPGLQRLAAVNHNVIGKRFIVTALAFFCIGGLLAMLLRAQLASPQAAFMPPELYNQVFTMHGTVMMFLFAIPLIEGLAIYLLPKMLGARDMAFPRMGAYGYWCYLFGGSILILAMIAGAAPDGGWFMYTPLSSKAYTPGINPDVWLLGVTFVEISAIAVAVEIIVTVLKMRAPGMSLDRMPIFAWYMLVTAFMMLFGFPPLILGSILLELERAFDLPFFDPQRGGDPLLWQHLFWLFGHPEVYIIFLPAAGAIATILPVFAGRPLVGYRAVILAIVALAFLSFGLWVHHMFTVGIPHLALAFFSAASALVAIPTGVQIFAWIATLARGRLRFDIPMLYLMGFFFIFVAGGLTGVMLAMVPFDLQAHDTHFVVAHLHYVLIGGFVFPMLAAAYFWLPHFTGREALHALSVPAFWLIFIGFNATFFLMHLTGLRGMPRRVSTYPADIGWDWLNLLSSVGSFAMAIGFALFLADMLLHLRYGRRVPRNLWRARTLDWAMATPVPPYNFASIPAVNARADRIRAERLAPRLAAGEGYLGFARERRLETLGVGIVNGRAEQLIFLPGPTYLPLWAAATTGLFVLALLFRQYWLLAPIAAANLGLFLLWAWRSGETREVGALPIGRGEHAPPHIETEDPPSRWAMRFVLAADGVLLASLVFGALFLHVAASGWPPPRIATLDPLSAWATAAMLIASAVCCRLAVRRCLSAERGLPWLAPGAAGYGAAAVLALFQASSSAFPDPTAHAQAATAYALLIYLAFHAVAAAMLALFALGRERAGYVSAVRSLDLRQARAWSDYAAFSGLAILAALAAFPRLL
ncbi:MAG: cytochrome c oxidase subunit I [Alphaproteobacteria bacterium]